MYAARNGPTGTAEFLMGWRFDLEYVKDCSQERKWRVYTRSRNRSSVVLEGKETMWVQMLGGVGGVYLIIASVFSVKKEARSSVHSDLLILQATLQWPSVSHRMTYTSGQWDTSWFAKSLPLTPSIHWPYELNFWLYIFSNSIIFKYILYWEKAAIVYQYQFII